MCYNDPMKETLEIKRKQIEAQFKQVSEQIVQLQHQQRELQGAYSVLGELIEESKSEEES